MEGQQILFHLMLKQGFNWFILTPKEQKTETFNRLIWYYRRWQERSIHCVISFFGFMHTNLPTDMDHMAESTIFIPWSKTVTLFPSLRKKIKAFKEDSRGQLTLTWMLLVSTSTKPPRNPRRHTPGKTRTRRSNHNHCFNLIKTNQVNMLGTDLTDANKIEIIKCTPQKACEWYEATCSFCRQQVPHASPDQSDWSSEDWDWNKAKAKEQKPIIKFDILWPKLTNPNLDPVNSIPFKDLMIQIDSMDKKAQVVLPTPIPQPEQGAVGTAPKDGQTKLDTVKQRTSGAGAKDMDRRGVIQTLYWSAKPGRKWHRHRNGWIQLSISRLGRKEP